jgi:2-haloacid dehalogenase
VGAVLPGRGVRAGREEILMRYAALEAAEEHGVWRPYRQVLTTVMAGLGRGFGVELSGAEAGALPESVARWPAFAETPAALAALQRRFKLAVISNVDDDLFAATAPKLGVRLDAVITAEQCRSYKPSLNNFRTALARLGAGTHEVVHVAESRYHDIVPARELGIRSVWVNRSGGRVAASGGTDVTPDLEVTGLTELVRIVEARPA